MAELRLGFWTALMSSRYEKTLWVPYLHKCFPHAKGKRLDGKVVTADRKAISEELEKIRVLRNRIAHHESILKPEMDQQYEGIVKVLGWMCPATAQWTRSTNCFASRYGLPAAIPVPVRFFSPQPVPPVPGVPRPKTKTGGA